MCGRKSCRLAPDDIVRKTHATRFGATDTERAQYRPRWNVAPGAMQPVLVRVSNGERHVRVMRWGLVPSFASAAAAADVHESTFNARDDALASSPLWRRLLHRKRCAVVCDGFFEWRTSDRRPFFVHSAEPGKPLLLAGLWDETADKKGLLSYTVVTTDAVGSPLGWLHERTPVVLHDEEALDAWLSCCDGGSEDDDDDDAAAEPKKKKESAKETLARLQPLLHAPREGDFAWYEVSDAVNNARTDTPDVVLPISQIRARNLDRFFSPTKKKREEEEEEAEEEAPDEKKAKRS